MPKDTKSKDLATLVALRKAIFALSARLSKSRGAITRLQQEAEQIADERGESIDITGYSLEGSIDRASNLATWILRMVTTPKS